MNIRFYLDYYRISENLLNKTNDSKLITSNANNASDDEGGDDADQDVEGSADHPADY